ncbi:MAG TPA: DUF4402 domain-containing protein [Salegentibacter sp.]|nr:DUF4402 domain-containing protein [Salegentibacter sp.]
MSVTSPAQNIQISTEQDLHFGEFHMSGNTGGTVMVSDSGAWNSTGGIHLLNPTHQTAVFLLSTDSPTPVEVQVETPSSSLSNADGKQMTLRLNSQGITSHIISQGNPKNIALGGTLSMDAEIGISPGAYTGSVLLRVMIYNE